MILFNVYWYDDPPHMELFVTCQQSLEPILKEELEEIGLQGVTEKFRGVSIPYSMENIYKVNYLSRIAGRVLYPLHAFYCRNKEDLYQAGSKIAWETILTKETTFAIDINGSHPSFNNTFYASQVLKDAICDRLRNKWGERPDVCVANPDVQLSLFLSKETVVISLDTSGAPLFKRGYRQETVKAPMQESLAAAILRLAKYTGEEVLLDPCCGSATILIEAAMIATKTPPGYWRKKWGFFHMPEFNRETWLTFRNEQNSQRKELDPGKILGYDIDRSSVKKARANCTFAGFHNIQITWQDFRTISEWQLPANLIICNPPHGERLGEEEELIPLYKELGNFFKRKLTKPAKAFLFTTSLPLSKQTGLKPDRRYPLVSSGTESRLLYFNIY